jgi:ferredoxin-NADP reductase
MAPDFVDVADGLVVRLAEVAPIATDVVALTLRSVDGQPLPAWTPGAHVDLHLPSGLVRQYSLCGHPAEANSYRIAILHERAGRGGSAEVHRGLRVGDLLTVSCPRNNFELDPSNTYLFLAGGIGITPILAMVRVAAAAGADWRLVYGGRTRDSMSFADELRDLDTARVRLVCQDTDGLIDIQGALDGARGPLVYCCGPEPLLAAVDAAVAGRRESFDLRVERFAPVAATRPAVGFDVTLARSDVTLHVRPDDSILEVIERAGIYVDFSCREGTCGTCTIRALEGAVDHRDSVLSEAERTRGDICICVSRALGPHLTLEI